MTYIDILIYGFLAIFFATAVLGIASIPGWIDIPEYYRKRIFIALILEVIGVIIILFKHEFIDEEAIAYTPPNISINQANWVALNSQGQLVNPVITVDDQDTIISKQLGRTSLDPFKGLSAKVTEDGLNILNTDNVNLATIKNTELKQLGLYNSIQMNGSAISSEENYAYVKWGKQPGANWKARGQFLPPFQLDVIDYAEGTYYLITNTETGITVYDSRNSSKNLFAVDNRIIHFLKHNNTYYLLRITQADLQSDAKYVHVLNIKLSLT